MTVPHSMPPWVLGDDPVDALCAIAKYLTGVQLDGRHREMVKSRLQKRLVELKLATLDDYVAYFQRNQVAETPRLVSLLTTHHSYFFREFAHFEFLLLKALPALVASMRARQDKILRVWSAACSRGQEVYSLAMFLDLHLKRLDPALMFEVYGTDIDEESIQIAKNGVYLHEDLKEVPLSLLGSHWARGTAEIENYVKARKSLRERCHFKQGNLLGMTHDGAFLPPELDIIFCRNVFIYFHPAQVLQIVGAFMGRLRPDGYLVVGAAESLLGSTQALRNVGPSAYQLASAPTETRPAKPAASPARTPSAESQASGVVVPQIVPARPLRILCVDDSASILTLLGQILSHEHGFEVVGVAKNGIEAAQKVTALRPDALTLDIHMPEMTGIAYLQQHFHADHPPVVMVTSVSRDDADLAGEALSLGASDYIEKPALSNLNDRGDEIRTKLRCACAASRLHVKVDLSLDRAFSFKQAPVPTDSSLRIVAFHLSQRQQLATLWHEFEGKQPPCVLLVDGAKDAMAGVAHVLERALGRPVQAPIEVPDTLQEGSVLLFDMASHTATLAQKHGAERRCSIMVYGEASRGAAEKLCRFANAQLLLEDLGGGRGTTHLAEVASDIVLCTSFAYLSDAFLAQASVPPAVR